MAKPNRWKYLPLIPALKAKQNELGESDIQFARRIGASQSVWYRMRRKSPPEKAPGPKFVTGALLAFPDLATRLWRIEDSYGRAGAGTHSNG